jgi:undecaprenyl pyrophosphate synthase
MPRKRAERERPSRYAVKAHDVLLSNWVTDVYEHWHDREAGEPSANAVRREIIGRLDELKSNVQRMLRAEKSDHMQHVRTVAAARLLLYGSDETFMRQVNKTAPGEALPELDLAAAEDVITNIAYQIASMEASDWRFKLRVLGEEVDP